MGSFPQDGRVISSSGLSQPPWIPLAIGVKFARVEIVGLDSESGLIMGEFMLNCGALVPVGAG